MTNIFNLITMLGVKTDMPIYQQKSIMLYNRLARFLVIVLLIVSLLFYFIKGYVILPIAFLGLFLVVVFSLVLNYKGKVYQSAIVIAFIIPFLTLAISIMTKKYGEGLSYTVMILPRFGILISSLLAMSIIGIKNITKSLVFLLPGLFAWFLFDPLHRYFGLKIEEMPFELGNHLFLILGLTGVFLFVALLILFLQQINRQYDLLTVKQNEEIRMQRDYLEKQNREITESIRYAARIQKAILQQDKLSENLDFKPLIYFKPRDIVSGDFYWFKKIENKFFVAAADCTGHGVPGAMLSMLGVSYLNEIILSKKNLKASEMLENLRIHFKESISKNSSSQKDGMDIAFCIIDMEKKTLEYAGAYNPLYLIRNNELLEYKATRNPIGAYMKEKKFEDHCIYLKEHDFIYIFSDGYVDQFGGKKQEKFKTKRFKNLLLKIHKQKINEQHEILEQNLENWKNNLNQIDDILIIGISIDSLLHTA